MKPRPPLTIQSTSHTPLWSTPYLYPSLTCHLACLTREVTAGTSLVMMTRKEHQLLARPVSILQASPNLRSRRQLPTRPHRYETDTFPPVPGVSLRVSDPRCKRVATSSSVRWARHLIQRVSGIKVKPTLLFPADLASRSYARRTGTTRTHSSTPPRRSRSGSCGSHEMSWGCVKRRSRRMRQPVSSQLVNMRS